MNQETLQNLSLPKAIFFDMDGILVDSEALHWESVHEVLKKHLGSQAPKLAERVGWGDHELWRELIETYSLNGTPSSLTEERGRIAVKLLSDRPPALMKNALSAIQAWSSHPHCPTLAVVSASPKDQMIQSLKAFTDSQGQLLFDHLISGVDDCEANKPSPLPYLTAMKYFALQPSECWIAEDSSTGLTAALASGAKVFAVGAHTADQKLIVQAQDELDTLADLFALWAKMNK